MFNNAILGIHQKVIVVEIGKKLLVHYEKIKIEKPYNINCYLYCILFRK